MTRSTSPVSRSLVLALLAALLASMFTVLTSTSAVSAEDPCGPGGNKIACENTKPGSPPSVWDIEGAGDDSIQGFATDISVNVGQRIDFKIDTNASSYTIDIYRSGYYGGNGARKIASVTPSASLPQQQPQCITEAATELYDCGNWAVSASWNVPSTAVSGVYFAHLRRADRNDESHITFIVRDDSSHSDVVFQTSDTTWQAYNRYGGSNFYSGGSNGRAYKLSYNRPVTTRSDTPWGRDFFFANEYPMVRFLERNGYDVSYIAGVDTHRNGQLLKNHKTFLSVGHDEYWTGQQRTNVKDARDAGVHLQFLSGNEMYWRSRFEPSIDGRNTAHRTLVTYKETWSNGKIDPSDEWTGTWRDPRFAPKAKGGGLPENGLTGTAYMVNYSDLPVTVTAAEGKRRLWRGTSLASMSSGSAQLAPHTVGYESNEDLDNADRPPGLIRLSTTTGQVPEYLQDFGNQVAPGSTTHHLTMYRAPSGALVFSAGSVQWTWGLDADHDSGFAEEPADPRMQQAQVNLFADMGVQPTTLMPGLVAATKSSDTTGPSTTISSPAAGATQANGTRVTVTGTASDAGGGVVAGVEVSTDGGSTWHAATGTTSWSYSFIQSGSGTTPIMVRAMDDSANIGATVTRSFKVTCPCSVFGNVVPGVPATDDQSAAELGLRFTAVADGLVTGVRFYKGPGNGGTHVGSLWDTAGQRLAQVTFTGETATGWQSASFSTPVSVTAGRTYVVSYTAPAGRYAVKPWAFSESRVESGQLQVDGGFGAAPAGVYSNAGSFPTSSYQNSNYYVDVVFTSTDESPLIAMNQWPTPDSVSAPLGTKVSAQFSKSVTPGSAGLVLKDANGATVPGSTAYDAASRVVTFTPSAPLSGFVKHTATVSGTDTFGNVVTTGKTWSFTTGRPQNPPGVCPCTLFDDSTAPSQLEDPDRVPVTLGVRFSSEASGRVTAVRFYKGPNNVGSHTGALWSANGTLLAEGTFTNESAAGWQELTFASPVTIARNTTYVASYRTTVGRYSATPNAFATSDLSRPPLRVTATSGAYTYGTGFPSSTSATSYLVDVVFERVAPSLTITAQDPAPGAVGVARKSPVRVWFSDTLATGAQLTVRSGSTVLAGTTALDTAKTRLTWTPAATLPADTLLTVSLTGAASEEGATLADQSWTFRTRDPDLVTAQSLFGDEVPQIDAVAEAAPVELGTTFTPSRDGTINAIRFFKGEGNLGTHIGSLWSSSGQRLASVTFTDESPRGWQTAALPTPVSVTAGATYVVSYLAPQGHYSYTDQFFSSPWTAGDLSAPAANNGRYLYGAAGGMPTFSWNAANYFVDVVFERTPAPFTVTGRSPSSGAIDVVRGVKPSISFSAPLAIGWTMSARQGTTPIAGQATLGADGRQVTFTPSAPLPPDTDVTVTASGLTSTDGLTLPTQTWTFHTEGGATVLTSLFSNQVPATAAVDDTAAVELGTAFTPQVDGTVTAIKFFKGAGNTGTHTGSIWSSTGARLATVTFTGETASGWQTATLATPVALTAGTTYVVSYHAPNGRYAATGGFFSTPWIQGPLTAPVTGNGRYRYGTGGVMPTSSWNATNYFVDVVFRHAATQ